MRGKRFAGFAVSLASALALTATVASAAGPGGVGGVSGIGSIGAIGAMSSIGAIHMGAGSLPHMGAGSSLHMGGSIGGGMTTGSIAFFPFPTNDPHHYHEIKLIGRLAKDESGLTIDQQIVRMRVNGQSIPMSINGDAISSTLQFDQGDELGQTLYRLILSKQLEVVGDAKLRSQLAEDAASTPPKQVLVDGYVYDRMTPYLVLVSVHDAP
jgi:hypothetical protein